MTSRLNTLFPLFAIIACGVAYWQPSPLLELKSWIIPLLTFIMFCMGLTLSLKDVQRVSTYKSAIGLGVLLQYSIMPLTAFLVSRLLSLPLDLLIGMVLVGSASGGTASNVMCYLAKADVALSISLTMCSTLLATIALPALTWLYVGQVVPVPAISMLISVAKIVLIPVLAGLAINHFLPSASKRIQNVLPVFTIGAIVLVIAIIVALNKSNLTQISVALLIAVALHNAVGILAGYWGSRLLKQNTTVARTIAIEVGMQNSGLAVALASKYFTPIAAFPGALFSIWHNITGSILAAHWSKSLPR